MRVVNCEGIMSSLHIRVRIVWMRLQQYSEGGVNVEIKLSSIKKLGEEMDTGDHSRTNQKGGGDHLVQVHLGVYVGRMYPTTVVPSCFQFCCVSNARPTPHTRRDHVSHGVNLNL